MELIVHADGYMTAGKNVYRAVYGRNGIGPKIREGDSISPEGTWPLRRAFYRPDRLEKPPTQLKIEPITPNLAWCDVPGDPQYNQLVTLPYSAVSEERLWRDDPLYDLVVVIGYNDNPVIDGKGSGIFLHLARPDYLASAGCAAVSLSDLLEIMPRLGPESTLTYTKSPLMNESIRWPYNPPSL